MFGLDMMLAGHPGVPMMRVVNTSRFVAFVVGVYIQLLRTVGPTAVGASFAVVMMMMMMMMMVMMMMMMMMMTGKKKKKKKKKRRRTASVVMVASRATLTTTCLASLAGYLRPLSELESSLTDISTKLVALLLSLNRTDLELMRNMLIARDDDASQRTPNPRYERPAPDSPQRKRGGAMVAQPRACARRAAFRLLCCRWSRPTPASACACAQTHFSRSLTIWADSALLRPPSEANIAG